MVRDNVFMIIDQKGTAYWSDVPSKSPYKYSITENTYYACGIPYR